VTNSVTFANTGTLALGASGGAQTYTGGITATAPSATTLKGTISTTDALLSFGSVALGAITTLNAGTNDITIAGTLNGAFSLTANSTGTTTFGGIVGGTGALSALTTNAGGTTTINAM